MPATSPCVPCCSEPQVTNVPGGEGDPGGDGINGTDAFTTTTADFVIPAIGANVTISVVNSMWMAIGQKIVFDGPATFEVVSLPGATSVTAKFKGYTDDLAPGVTILAGAKVSPSGTQPALGTLTVTASGTPYNLTATPALLDFTGGGSVDPSLTITSPGDYLLFARVRLDYAGGCSFVARRTVTIKIRRTNNTPADLTGATDSFSTQIIAVQTFIAGTVHLVAIPYTTANSTDILQLWGDVSVVPSAGSLDASEASIMVLKLS